MLGKLFILSWFVAAITLFAIWQATTPADIGPLGILVVFVLMYVLILGVITSFFWAVNRLIVWGGTRLGPRKATQPMSLRRSYYFASVISLAPVMVIGMQSVGEVGIYELGLVVIFIIVSCVYIAKRTG